MPEDFDMRVLDDEGTSVLVVTGELDLSHAEELRAHLDQLPSGDHGSAIVDLSAVEFLDSTALGVLVYAQRVAREHSREIRLVVDRPHIRKVFEITGLDTIFQIFTTRAEARR